MEGKLHLDLEGKLNSDTFTLKGGETTWLGVPSKLVGNPEGDNDDADAVEVRGVCVGR